jgi:isoleucyl-tRNA synthetase
MKTESSNLNHQSENQRSIDPNDSKDSKDSKDDPCFYHLANEEHLTNDKTSSSRQPIFPLLVLSQLPDDPTYIAHEHACTQAWNHGSETKSDLYSRMVEKNKDSSEYVFLDGPPFVSGTLHPGHVAVGAVKSIVFGYQNMKGKSCSVKLGYDCHGLPAINKTAQENGLDTLEKINNVGLLRFNEMCDKMISKYSSSWTPLIQRLGRLADFDNVYMTRDVNFMETCFWIFKEIWNKGLVYKGNKVMAYSYSNQTPLSNFEAALNYQDKETKSTYVRFKLDSNQSDQKEYIVAWTTTPWTLPANLALCVNPEIEYVRLSLADEPGVQYIVGKQCVNNLFTTKQKITIIDTFKGSKLIGLRYKPLFPFTLEIDKDLSINREYRIVGDSYVTIGEIGTAVVHLAPAFGEEDFRICCTNGLIDNKTVSEYCPLDAAGQYTDRIKPYAGRLVFDCENDIRADLKKTGDLLKTQLYKHSYPYCWRSDTPLIYRTTPSWYIRVTALKDRLIELNKTVNWYPSEIGENRFHQWLSGAKDWAISRSTSYATPIPIWVSDENQDDILCIGSIAELEELTGQKISNLHPEYLNDLVIHHNGKIYRRISDTFDCWFESGAAPMGQLHYPFSPESKILDSREYLSDFICEGMDQTRGWFYTLLVLSTIIFDRAPYRNVMCTGMVLDRNGHRFAKKLGNYVDPMITISEYGADIIRVFFVNSPVISADSVKFNEEHIAKLKRRFTPYYNGVRFWIEHTLNYMKVNGLDELILEPIEQSHLKNDSQKFTNLFDRWIILRTDELVRKVNVEMDRFRFGNACDILLDFIDDLTNWYIKFNRDRLKGLERSELNNDWLDSITVLYNVLMTYCKLWAPFTPFLSEHIYQHLRCCSAKYRLIDSVLLTQYPESQITGNSDEFESVLVMFRDLQRVCAIVRGMRDDANPKKRKINDEKDESKNQENNMDKPKLMHSKMVVPLLSCTIYHDDETYMNVLEKNIHLVQSELNCLSFLFKKLQDNVKISVEIDRSSIGKFFRKDANNVIKTITSQSEEFLMRLYNGEVRLEYKSDTYNEILDDRFYKLQRVPGSINTGDSNNLTKIDRDLMVTVDCTYDESIHNRYQVKRLHSMIQNIRKQMALRPWNKIIVVLDKLYADTTMINSLSESLTNAEILSCDFTYNIKSMIVINAINGMIPSGLVTTDNYIGFNDTFKLECFDRDQSDTHYIEGRLLVFHFKSSQ